MAIALSDHEAAPRFRGDHGETLVALQTRLSAVQRAHIVHGRRAMIVFEGWDGSGRGDAIRRLTASWDMRRAIVHAIAPPTAEERARHYLARFWARLPGAGEIAVFDRSWYGRVLADRVAGLVDRAQWRRSYDEINEFEAQQKDGGTTLVKLFLHIGADEQDRRLRARAEDPWARATLTAGAIDEVARRAEHVAAAEEMFARTDTRWAPWTVIDAGHRKQARIAALTRIVEVLEKAVPATPPAADEAIAAWARDRWGLALA